MWLFICVVNVLIIILRIESLNPYTHIVNYIQFFFFFEEGEGIDCLIDWLVFNGNLGSISAISWHWTKSNIDLDTYGEVTGLYNWPNIVTSTLFVCSLQNYKISSYGNDQSHYLSKKTKIDLVFVCTTSVGWVFPVHIESIKFMIS